MAFLDNSGDIILDAVLTDVGRQRMARGEFRIVKFALGDDEIDYGLYNKNHPSGSAYADLEILQTPVFEATTNLPIKNMLPRSMSNNILYFPVAIVNEKAILNVGNIASYNNVFHVIDTSGDTGTTAATNIATLLDGLNIGFLRGDSSASPNNILIETGINTTEAGLGTAGNQTSLITGLNLGSPTVTINVDSRFLDNVMTIDPSNSMFANNAGETNGLDAQINMVMSTKITTQGTTIAGGTVSNISSFRGNTITNKVYANSSGNNTQDVFSNVKVPAEVTAISLVPTILNTQNYTDSGTTNDSTTYSGALTSYIDTIVECVAGMTTKQIVARIIRIA